MPIREVDRLIGFQGNVPQAETLSKDRAQHFHLKGSTQQKLNDELIGGAQLKLRESTNSGTALFNESESLNSSLYGMD